MLFNSLQFLIFFPIVFLLYYVVPHKLRNIWLLIASYYFYMCWNAKYAILIIVSTLVTWGSGLAIDRIRSANDNMHSVEKKVKICLVINLLINLGILGIFKYTNFFISTINKILGIVYIETNVPAFDIMLPVGISFYTFQALSYTIDVYRKDIEPEKNLLQYALFVSFFPQLVAGPIERSGRLLGQLAQNRKFDFESVREGFLLMLWGFFMKIVIADRIAIFVDVVYSDIERFGGYYLLVASFLFAFQIYCDFGGYSCIALGSAKMLGIELMDNFNSPYLSKSVNEFWNRWHISLSSWFKDYLYIPLGGNRKGTIRKYVNKMIVFLVSGLWHGASWSFVIWGGLHGIYQIVGEALMPFRDKIVTILKLQRNSLGHRISQIVVTFVLTDFAWIFFRAQSVSKALEIVKSIITVNNKWILWDDSLYLCGLNQKNFMVMIMGLFVLAVADFIKYKGICVRIVIGEQDYWFRWIVIAGAITAILLFGVWGPEFNEASFIYFQF